MGVRRKLRRKAVDFFREIIQAETDDFRVPVRERLLKLLQSGQRLRVTGERLLRLADGLKSIRLLYQAVNGDVLVVGTLLGARLWQRDGKNQSHECGKTFHAGKIAEHDTVWQRWFLFNRLVVLVPDLRKIPRTRTMRRIKSVNAVRG